MKAVCLFFGLLILLIIVDRWIQNEILYWDNIMEKLLLKKIDKGEDLDKLELKILTTKFAYEHRTLDITDDYEILATIAKISGRYFYLPWKVGGDVRRIAIFEEQPKEVHLETRTETRVEVKERQRWVDSSGNVLL